jgi:carbon-monoxide dehydrogenase small subunit
MKITLTLNGQAISADAPPDWSLLRWLREDRGLTGTKCGCEVGECGACAVLVDDRLVNACLLLAAQVDGCTVLTIEGVHDGSGGPNDLQQAFIDHGAVQCGYCSPGMVLAGEALLASNPTPTEADIRAALVGHLCRCTGYQQIIEAIAATASRRMAQAAPVEEVTP